MNKFDLPEMEGSEWTFFNGLKFRYELLKATHELLSAIGRLPKSPARERLEHDVLESLKGLGNTSNSSSKAKCRKSHLPFQ